MSSWFWYDFIVDTVTDCISAVRASLLRSNSTISPIQIDTTSAATQLIQYKIWHFSVHCWLFTPSLMVMTLAVVQCSKEFLTLVRQIVTMSFIKQFFCCFMHQLFSNPNFTTNPQIAYACSFRWFRFIFCVSYLSKGAFAFNALLFQCPKFT